MWEVSPIYMLRCCIFTGVLVTLTLADPSRYDKQVRRAKRDIVIDAKFVGDALYDTEDKREEIPVPPAANAVPKDTVSDPSKDITNTASSVNENGDVKSTIKTTDKTKDKGSLLSKKFKSDTTNTKSNAAKVAKKSKDESKDQKKVVQSRGDVQKKDEDESLIKDKGDAQYEEEGARVSSHAPAVNEPSLQQEIANEQQQQNNIVEADSSNEQQQNNIVEDDTHTDAIQTGDNIESIQSSELAEGQPQNQEMSQNSPSEVSKRSHIDRSGKQTPLSDTKRSFHGTIKQIFDKLYDNHHPSQNHKQTHANYNIIDQRPGLMRRRKVLREKNEVVRTELPDKPHIEAKELGITNTPSRNNTIAYNSSHAGDKNTLSKGESLHKQVQEDEKASKRFCMNYHDSCCHEMCPPQHMHHVHHHHRHIHHEDHQIVLHRPGVIYHPAPTVVHRPDIIIHRPPLLVHRPVIVVHQPPVILHRPPVYYKQPDVIFHTPHSIVREPTIYSHDMYTHVPHLQQVDSHIENHELTTHIGDQCGNGDTHSYNMCGSVKGTSYEEKGAGDYYNTEKYGDMNDENQDEQGATRSAIVDGDSKSHKKVKNENHVKRLNIPSLHHKKKNHYFHLKVNKTFLNSIKRQEIDTYSSYPRRHIELASHVLHGPPHHRHHRHLHVGEQNIVLHRPGVIYHPSPTVVHRPIIVIHRPPLLVHRPSIVVHQPPVVIHRPPVYYKQPDVVFHTPPPEVHEPMYQSHDLYRQVPRLEHVNSHIETTETLVHPIEAHNEIPVIAENHSEDADLTGYHLQGEHYHDKGAGDMYGTENYGEIKAEEGKEETGSSRSELPFNYDREYNYDNNNNNGINDYNDDMNARDRDSITQTQETDNLNTENFSTAGDEQSRKRRSTLHDAYKKHHRKNSTTGRKRNHLAKKHRIVVSRPDIIYHQSPEIVHRPPIIVHRPDVVVHRPSILVRRPAVVVHRPAIAYHQPPVVFSTPNPIIERPTAVSHDMFVQRNFPQPVGSRIERIGTHIGHPHATGHVIGLGHDISTADTMNAHHGDVEIADDHADFAAHGEAQVIHGDDQGLHGEEQGQGELIQGDELQGQAEEDVVQGPVQQHLQHEEIDGATEFAPAGNENLAHEALTHEVTSEPTGEATQDYDQGQLEGVHQGGVLDGVHQGFETDHDVDSLPQGLPTFHRGVDLLHHQRVESFSPYDQPQTHHFSAMTNSLTQEFSPKTGSTFDPAGRIMGMENPVTGDDQPWAKSHVPSHKGHKHHHKHKKEKMKHAKAEKKSGGFGGEMLPQSGFANEKIGPDYGVGAGAGPQGLGGCGLLHGGPPCGDQFGASGGDLGGMNLMGPQSGATGGGGIGGGGIGGGGMGGAPMGDHNAGCIEDCTGNDNHACCGTQSTVLYRPDVIFHPRPELYHRPDIIVHRPDVVIHRPSVVIHQPPVLVHRPSVVVHQPPIIFHQPAPEIRRPQLVSHDQYVTHPVPEKVGSEIHHTGNIIAHGGYYDGKDASGLWGGGFNAGGIGGGGMGGGSVGGGMGIGGGGGGMDMEHHGGCGNGADAANCGVDQRTDVNGISHGLDSAQEAVHFGNGLTSGCAEGSGPSCGGGGIPGGAGAGCSGSGCGGAFGKSKVESPDKKDKGTKKDVQKGTKAEIKELKKEDIKEKTADKKELKKENETKPDKRKEIEKESKKEAKIVKRATEDSTRPRNRITTKGLIHSANRIRKSIDSTAASETKSNSDDKKTKRDCYEAHNANCHTFPGHATVIHRPDVVFHQRPEIIHRPDIVVHRPDVVIHRPDVVIHRPALVVHKPPMVIKQSPIVFHQEHPVVQQPVQQANDMYVTHNVPLRVGSHVEEAGTQISNGCHYPGDEGCDVSHPYTDHSSGRLVGGLPGGITAGGLSGGLGGEGIAAGGVSDGGYSTGDEGAFCGHNPYSHDCGGMKKTKVAHKKRKSRKKHEISMTGSKRYFQDGGHAGGHDDGYGEGGHGYGGGGHDGGGGGGGGAWHGGYEDGHGEGHGGHHHFDFDHSAHEGGHGHGHDGDWGDSGHGGHGEHHGGDHNVHHADEQNIIVQRPDIVFHPRPELYHRPDIVVHRPDIVIHRPSVVIHQPPVLVHRPAVIYHQPPVVFHQPGPVVHRPRVVSHDMYVQHAAKEQVGSQIEHAGGDFVGHGGYYEGHEHEGHGGGGHGFGGGDHGGYEDGSHGGGDDGGEGDHGDSGGDHEGGFHRDGGAGDHEDGPNFHGFHFGDHGFGHHGLHGGGHGDDHGSGGDHESGGPNFHGFHFGDHGFGHHGGHDGSGGDHESGGPSFHGFHFGDHGFGHHGGPHGHGGGYDKRSKIARHKHHKTQSGSKKHNVVVYRPPIIYHPPSEVYHRAPLIVHRPDVVIHRPAVVIHRPPVVVHRPDIIYHQSPVVFDTPPPRLHQEVLKQHDNFVMRPVLQHVTSHLHKTGIIHTSTGPKHESTTVINSGSTPLHILSHGHHGHHTAVHQPLLHTGEALVGNLETGATVTGHDLSGQLGEGGEVTAESEPWPEQALVDHQTGAHETLIDGDDLQHEGDDLHEDNEHAALLMHSGTHPVHESQHIQLTGGEAALDHQEKPLLNGQHIQVMVDGHSAVQPVEQGVALTGVDNSNELTHSPVGHAEGFNDNGEGALTMVEGKPDEDVSHQTAESNGADGDVLTHEGASAVVGETTVEGHEDDEEGHTDATAEHDDATVADGHHFASEAKEDGSEDHIENAKTVDDGQHIEAKADEDDMHVDNEEISRGVTGNIHTGRHSGEVAAHHDDDEIITDNSLLEHEPEADGTAPAPEPAVNSAKDTLQHQYSTVTADENADSDADARDKTSMPTVAKSGNQHPSKAAKEESGSGKSTVTKKSDDVSKKEFKKGKKAKKRSKVDKKRKATDKDIGKSRRRRESLLAKLSSSRVIQKRSTTQHKIVKVARGKKNKKRSKMSKNVQGDDDDKHRKSKKNDIVVKRPPVIYHPPPEIYHRPPIIVHRPPLVIRRPPIIYHQPPVIVHRPAVVYHQPPLVFHQPPPAVSQPILKSHDTFMMHPAAHLTHMGSMVTNAGTYVGVPEHRFMYQSGMGFLHAPGGGQENEHNVQNMQYGDDHHGGGGGDAEHAMPQEMEEGGGGGGAPEGGYDTHDEQHASINGGAQQMVDQAMNENDQSMGGAPGGAESEMVDNNAGQQQGGVENQNGGFQNEAAYGRNEVPGDSQNMWAKKEDMDDNLVEKDYKSYSENKRKSIPKRENSTSTDKESNRTKRQVDGLYSPYPSRQPYPYVQENNNDESNYFRNQNRHHRRTTVNVDVIGKRKRDASNDNTFQNSKTHFLR